MYHIPDKIVICNKDWTIYREKDAPKKFKREWPDLYANSTYGFTHPASRSIVLADGLPQDLLWITFIHEVLHAVYYSSNDPHLSTQLEEYVVEAMDEPLAGVISQLIKNATSKKQAS